MIITHKQLTEWFGGNDHFDKEDCMEVLLSLINNEYSVRSVVKDIKETLDIDDEPNIKELKRLESRYEGDENDL